jgi:hypothetical protein
MVFEHVGVKVYTTLLLLYYRTSAFNLQLDNCAIKQGILVVWLDKSCNVNVQIYFCCVVYHMCGQYTCMDGSMLGVRIVSNYYAFLWANRVCPFGPALRAHALIRAACMYTH